MKSCLQISLMLCLVLLVGCQSTPEPNSYAKADKAYSDFLTQVENKSHLTDFTELRDLYTETSYYSPLVTGNAKLLLSAFKEENFPLCIELAQQHLDNHQVSLLGHYTGMVCNAKGDQPTQYLYHQYMLDGLMESISASGKGSDKNTPIKVISKEEMVFFVDLSGLTMLGQKLERSGNKVLDKVTVRHHPQHPEFELYFDLSLLEIFHITSQLKAVD